MKFKGASLSSKPNLILVNYETLYFETLYTCTTRNFMSTGRSSSYEREQKDINNNNNNGHIFPTQVMQIFGSASCVQQLIIPERINQIYIVWDIWKEEILSFPTMCHSSKPVTCIKFKGSSYGYRRCRPTEKSALGTLSFFEENACILLELWQLNYKKLGVFKFLFHNIYKYKKSV